MTRCGRCKIRFGGSIMKKITRSLGVVLIAVLACCTVMQAFGKDPYRVAIVVVFKKNVDESSTARILERGRYIFSPNRGKRSLMSGGPAFTVYVPVDMREAIKEKLRKIPEIHEVYDPDWSKRKD